MRGLVILALLLAAPGRSETVNIGLVSFDLLISGGPGVPGVNTFNIMNLTGDPLLGGFALPPDFPVLDSLIFLNSSLTVIDGGNPITIPLGDMSPGVFSPTDPVQFTDTALISSAVFHATLSQTGFLLSDGRTFTAASSSITAELLPSAGLFLAAGADFALIAISDVPEPGTFLLMAVSLVAVVPLRAKQV